MNKVIVIKIGGSTLGSHDTTIEDLVKLQKEGNSLVVVHGGGKVITDWLAKQGVPSRFVQGERVTDQPTLDVVVAVLAGLVNKELVTAINRRGGRAVGISGADGALLEGKIKDPKMGFVGEVTKINTTLLTALLQSGFIPVIAPVGFNVSETSSNGPQTLNLNADVAAGELAAAINAESLIFLTDVTGILDQSGKLLPSLTTAEAEALLASGIASGGMIPKVKACLKALSGQAQTCIIDGRQPHALLQQLKGEGCGTTIRK
ncbi:MAG: acetylglutamate kinase [Chloroflexota bacterium]